MSENTTEIIYRLEHDKRRLSTELDDLQHDIGMFIECGTHLDKDDAESLRTEDGIELYNVLHDVQQKHYETLTALAAEESDKILYRNQRDDLAYELNQTISYLITLEQGNPLRHIADTIAHLVAVLRNMNTAIDELNATLLEGGE